jgi:signal transduction histidine kinase
MSTLVSRLRHYPRLNLGLQRLWAWAGGVSVRTKILGIVLTLTIVLGLGVTWQVRQMMSRTLLAELEERGQSVASDLAARTVDPILLNDTFTLYELLSETLANHSDIVYAFVLDPQGRVLAHTFEDGFPTGLLRFNQPAPDGQIQHQLYSSNQGRIHDFAAPIFEGKAGAIRLGVSEVRLHSTINAVTGQMLLTTLLVALAGIAAASLLTWLLTRPILQLVETTRRVGQGDLTARAPHWADDEIGDLADAFNQMVSDLAASQAALAEKEAARGRLLAQLINAQEEERRRIARELHDGVGQALTSLMVGLKLINQPESSPTVESKTTELRQIVSETLEDVRLLSRQLRPSVLDDLGLAAALERYAAEFRSWHPGLTVDLHCDLPQRLPPPVETTLYRIVQEAMTNAARHGQANTVSVLLSTRNGRVQAIIEDDGCGFDPVAARRSKDSVGLHSMAERAELLGGELNIESSREGTTVYVEAPV